MNSSYTLEKIHTIMREKSGTAKTNPGIFYKTAPGDYAHHDQFLGVPVPDIRRLASRYCRDFGFLDIDGLMESPFNEERLLALFILIQHYERGTIQDRRKVYDYYVGHFGCVNNWNLVDASAHLIMGRYLFSHGTADLAMETLITLSASPILWERRIAIVATWYFTRQGVFDPTLQVAKELLGDDEDLIHKAIGWMLREVGKRDVGILISFLNVHAPHMPRVTMRYAIEKFDDPLRKFYLKQKKSHVTT